MFFADCCFARFTEAVSGRYVYILDDDDFLVYNRFVEDLKHIVEKHDPDVIMVKAQFPTEVLPIPWGGQPAKCKIGSPNFVVRSQLWKAHIHEFCVDGRGGDFAVITKLFKLGLKIHWWDQIVAKVPQIGKGRLEV